MEKNISSHAILYGVSVLIFCIGIALLFFPPSTKNPTVKILTPFSGSSLPAVSVPVIATPRIPEKQAPVSNAEGIMKNVQLQIQQGSYEEALQFLVANESKITDKKQVQRMKADIYVLLKQYDKAVKAYEALHKIFPNDRQIEIKKWEMSLHSLDENTLERGVRDAQNALLTVSQERASLYLQCITHAFLGEETQVSELCPKVEKAFEGSREADIAHAFSEHYAVFSTFKDGSDAYLLTLHAKTFTEAGFPELSISTLKKVVGSNKDYRDAWTLLGYDYLTINQNSLALNALEKAYTLDTTKAYIQYLLAVTHDRMGSREKAISYYSIALSNRYEKDDEIRRRLTELYVENKNYQLAVDQYLALFAKTKPEKADDYAKLMWLYLDMLKNSEKGLSLAFEIQKSFPGSPMTDNYLGWAYFDNGKYQESLEALDRGLARDSKLAPLYLNRARTQKALGKTDEARKDYLTAYEMAKGTAIGDLAGVEYNALLAPST